MSTNNNQNSSLDSSLNCSATRCNEDENINKLVCADCKRSFHYRCTKLPAYQIQAYIVKKKRNYYCCNCITVPAELERIVKPISNEQQEINRLRRDIKRCENITKISEENTKLTQQLINEQLTKFDDKRIESYIDKKFNKLENCMKEYQSQSKINNQSYSDMLKKDTQGDFKTIIRVAKIEEKKEERDHAQRQSNIIIHGTIEDDSKSQEDQVNQDKELVTSLLKDTAYNASPKYIGRIGNKADGKSRPLKVVFNTEKEKRNLFANLKALKGLEKYQGISISDDYTRAERDMIKTWATQAKEKNTLEPKDSNVIWRVRGNPKSGLMLRKFAKAPSTNQ